MNIRKPIWIILLIFPLLKQGLAYEQQFNFSTYFDSNPVENIENKQPTFGLKVKGGLRFEKASQVGRIYGSILSQGFLEPALFLDSKVILNGDLGAYYKLLPGYRLKTGFTIFQKLYFDEFQKSGRSTLSLSLMRIKSAEMHQELGFRRTYSHINYGTLFQYADQRVFLNLTRHLKSDFQAEITAQFGQIEYENYPARIIVNDSLILNDNINQQDLIALLGLHVKHTGKMIWGVTVNFQEINSNSDIEESRIWSGKLYASGRISEQIFFHAMLQGMKKIYSQTDVLEASPYRDPEENIQNQLHIQLERVIHPSRVLYIQYSYIKNETVFNHWYYDKNLFETGIKLSF